MKTEKLQKILMVLITVYIVITIGRIGYFLGEKAGRKLASVVEETVQHTKVIEQCNRINLLSCIACHDFPAYVIDVEPEIWEE